MTQTDDKFPSSSEEFKLLKNPDLDLAQLKFFLSLPENASDETRKAELLAAIKEKNMAPYYEIVCKDLNWKICPKTLKAMQSENAKVLEDLDKEIEYADSNFSVVDVKEAYLNKARYLSEIGDKEGCLKSLSLAFDKTVAISCKLDNVFHCIRIGLFFMDHDLLRRSLQRAEDLLEFGADWQSRNCFKIYKGLYSLSVRDFKDATANYVDAVTTFTCTEVLPFKKFIQYLVWSAMLTLDRGQLKESIIKSPDVLQVLHYDEPLHDFVFSLYNCEYADFFRQLAAVEGQLREDMLLNAHYKFYVREMKIKAYDQLLATYKSLSLDFMADQFGVSPDFIESDLSGMIAAGRLSCKIDKVNGTVVNIAGNAKNDIFRSIIKHGDLLLNRIQKLGRVINV